MFSFRSLALIVLGAPFLSACIESACDLPQYKDMSFCQATDMGLTQDRSLQSDGNVDLIGSGQNCQIKNDYLLSCEYFIDKSGFKVDSVSLNGNQNNVYNLVVASRAESLGQVDMMKLDGLKLLSVSRISGQIYGNQHGIMMANKSNVIASLGNSIFINKWSFVGTSFVEKQTACRLLSSGANIYSAIGGSSPTVYISRVPELTGKNLAGNENKWGLGMALFGNFDKDDATLELLSWSVAGTTFGISNANQDGTYGPPATRLLMAPSICASSPCSSLSYMPVTGGDVNGDKITDLIVANANGNGIVIFKGVVDMLSGYFVDNISHTYIQPIKDNLAMATKVQAIAVAIPSGESFNASDPPRLVWATAEDVTSTNQTKVTVKILTLTLP